MEGVYGEQRMEIRVYEKTQEMEWLVCRYLSFLDTAYWDDALARKETFKEGIDFVAWEEKIVGILEIEVEAHPGDVGSSDMRSAMIHTLAVLPEFRRRGFATLLLEEAKKKLSDKGISRLEAWTRDDEEAVRWYEKNGFSCFESYWHVYLERGKKIDELFGGILKPQKIYAHTFNIEKARDAFNPPRIHACWGYQLLF